MGKTIDIGKRLADLGTVLERIWGHGSTKVSNSSSNYVFIFLLPVFESELLVLFLVSIYSFKALPCIVCYPLYICLNFLRALTRQPKSQLGNPHRKSQLTLHFSNASDDNK